MSKSVRQAIPTGKSMSEVPVMPSQQLNVTIGVSPSGVFTVRAPPTIMPRCRLIRTSVRASANESGRYARIKASAKKHLPINVASCAPTCIV